MEAVEADEAALNFKEGGSFKLLEARRRTLDWIIDGAKWWGDTCCKKQLFDVDVYKEFGRKSLTYIKAVAAATGAVDKVAMEITNWKDDLLLTSI